MFGFFAIQLDETTDVENLAELFVYVGYIHERYLEDQFLFCSLLITRITAKEIFNFVNKFFDEHNLKWKHVIGVCTDGAPAMLSCRSCFQSLVKEKSPGVAGTHCTIYVLDDVVKAVNFIKPNALNSCLLLLLLSAFPFSQGWPQRIIILHIFLSSMSVSTPTYSISSFTTSKNLLFGLPLFHYLGNSIFIIFLPTYSWSLFMTYPYHLSLPSLISIPNRSTLTELLMFSFLILFLLVTFIANLSILISSTCFFITATVSSPYTIAGLTTELYTFPFTLAGKSCRRLLLILLSIRSILPVLSFLLPSHNHHFLALLIPNT